MKDLLISHIADPDGISPICLLNLTKIKFDYELKEINEIDDFMSKLLDTDLSIYRYIYITDLSLSEKTYDLINNSAFKYKFKVFDHHKTHLFATKYDYVTIDINECGTTLFYKYLSKNKRFKKSVKEYVEHIKNIDLWLWQKNNDMIAKDINNLFDIYGRNRYIDEITKKLKKHSFKISKFEKKLLLLEQSKIDRYILKKEEEMIKIKFGGLIAGLVFCERYKSELGNSICSNHPEIDYIIMINLAGGISFRCSKDLDISEIAVKLNGGGHKKACGAPISNEERVKIIKDIFKGCEIIDK